MIFLKVQHNHHFPCHPTKQYLQNQASINETDREHNTDQQSEEEDELQYKIVESRAIKPISDVQYSEDGSIKKKPKKKKNNKNIKITEQQIYNTPLLDQAFKASSAKLPVNIRALIMKQQKLIQDKVYIGATTQSNNNTNSIVLQKMYQEDNINSHNIQSYARSGLIDMMNQISSAIDGQIKNTDQYFIHKIIRSSKNDILNNRKGRLNMNYELNNQTTYSFPNNGTSEADNATTNSQPVPPTSYEFDSQQTKKAGNFIKKIQQEQVTQRKKRKQQQQAKKSMEVRSVEQKKKFEEEVKQERRNYLKRRFEVKKQTRQKQLEIRQKMNKQYKQYLVKHKKKTPLFMKKAQQFDVEKSAEQDKLRNYILNKRRDEVNSIKFKDLKQHQRRYKQYKNQKLQLKQNQKKLKISQNHTKTKATFPKSKYFEILVQEQQKQKQRMIKQDPKYIRSQLIKKRDLYSRSVKEHYLPKGSALKHQELQDEMQKIRWSEQLRSHKKGDRQYIIEGDKNLKDLHKQIEELRKQGKLPQQHLNNNTIDYYSPQKPKYKNYLESVKPRRSMSIDYDRTDNMSLDQLQQRANNYQLKANRRYIYADGRQNIASNFKEKRKADEDYLQSVKAKVILLNKINKQT